MKARTVILCSILVFGVASGAAVEKDVTELQIGVKHRPATCEKKAKAGDKVDVHYTVRVPRWSVQNPPLPGYAPLARAMLPYATFPERRA